MTYPRIADEARAARALLVADFPYRFDEWMEDPRDLTFSEWLAAPKPVDVVSVSAKLYPRGWDERFASVWESP